MGTLILPLQPEHNGSPPLLRPSSPSPRRRPASPNIKAVCAGWPLIIQFNISPDPAHQQVHSFATSLETLPSFPFLPEVKENLISCFVLKRTLMFDAEIAREIKLCVSSGQVGLGVTIQYTQDDKLVSIKGKAMKMKLLLWVFALISSHINMFMGCHCQTHRQPCA